MHSYPAATLDELLAPSRSGYVGLIYRNSSTPVIPEIVYHITTNAHIRAHVAHVPISFALLERNQRSVHRDIPVADSFLVISSESKGESP
jgi:hypothetical protein